MNRHGRDFVDCWLWRGRCDQTADGRVLRLVWRLQSSHTPPGRRRPGRPRDRALAAGRMPVRCPGAIRGSPMPRVGYLTPPRRRRPGCPGYLTPRGGGRYALLKNPGEQVKH